MKTTDPLSNKEKSRRTFLVRLAGFAVAGISAGSVLGRIFFKSKTAVNSSAQTVYPKIHSMAVPRENKKV